ncbi:PQ-loop repeat-containing protein 3 isoform X2 [Zootermopsis nevadensis]|uniref:PQ-loop repeat-containing protein 3 isoform X2 n=1 Tax=Zootermopsis nevadensis TaxID=136037 RepID=UPI000B8EBE01|nr:PQ-loop repeat-containing protein 3 isoform X2 [Zootermopsis nevadensis]
MFMLIVKCILCYTVMTCYNYCNNYSLLSYMEYPIILVQQIILIFLVLKYMGFLGMNSFALFGLYIGITGAFVFGLLPKTILAVLAPMCTPISASSKVVQLIEILRTRNSESISVLTWFLSAFTNFTRVFTIYMDSADVTLLVNFSVSVFLSSSIMFSAMYYKHPKRSYF